MADSSDGLAPLAQRWLRHKTVSSRTDTANSDTARRTDLAWWGRQLSGADRAGKLDVDVDLADVTAGHLTGDMILEILYEQRGKLRVATLKRRLSTLRSFCRHLSAEGLLSPNPFDDPDLRISSVPDSEPKSITADEYARMLAAAAAPPPNARSAWPARDVALITVIAKTGVRAAECAALQWSDFEFTDPPVLQVRRATKSGRQRNVPFGRDVNAAIEALATDAAELNGHRPEGLVFTKKDGSALHGYDLHYIVNRIAAAAGVQLPPDAVVHALRHHFGHELARRRVPLSSLAQLMGHADPRTTAGYTRQRAAELADTLHDAGWL